MIFDAIVLAGGRASRLDGVSKADLVVEGQTLLSRTLDATAGARRVVIVGTPSAVPVGVLVTREVPLFGGPAAAIAAGLEALAAVSPNDFVLVLACDVPNGASAVGELLARAAEITSNEIEDGAGADGILAIDADGHRQPLLGLYRSGPLATAVRRRGPDIHNLSVGDLLSALDLTEIRVPPGSTEDIDTWADAAGFGISPPSLPAPHTPGKGQSMTDRNDDTTSAALTAWSDRLIAALSLDGVEVDIDAVLALAGTAAHEIMRPAAPLTTYLVGYAAGVAAATSARRGGFEEAASIAAALAKSGGR
jgi:molybdopterin-guanine dinucleotide biosynthesis protein A